MAETQDLQRLVVQMEANYRRFERELQKASGVADREVNKIQNRFRKLNPGIEKGFSDLARDLEGRMQGFAERLGPIGGVLAGLGPVGLAASAGIGALGFALGTASQRAAEADKVHRRLEAVLRITGNAAGLTAAQIDQLANRMEASTGVAADDVKSAAAALATFTSIGSENFERTLKIANDISTVFGGNLRENVDRVARALDDPLEGFAALRRSGFALADAEREVVEQMLRIGDVAGAQRVVLENLEKQVGGASAAQSQGLSGAFARATTSIGKFIEEIARRSGIVSGLTGVLNGLAGAADNLNESLERFTDKESKIDSLIASYEEVIQVNRRLAESSPGPLGDVHRKQAEEAERELQKLRDVETARRDFERKRRDDEEIAAREAERRAQRSTATDRAQSRANELQEQLKGYETNTEKLARARDEYERALADVKNMRSQGLVDPEVIDQIESNATALYDRQVEGIQKVMDAEAKRSARAAGRLDELDRERRSIEEEILMLEREAASIGKTSAERDKARIAQELENAARRAGIELTPALIRDNERLAEAYALAAERVREAQTQQEQLMSLQREFGDLAMSGISGLIDGTKSLNDVLADTAKRLADLALRAVLLGDGPLAGLFGTAGSNGSMGGLIGGLFKAIGFGGARASGGPVQSGKTYLVGENGPELVQFGRNGTVIPNHALPRGSAGSSMQVAIYEAPGTKAGVQQTDGPQGARLEVQIEQLLGGMISDGRLDKPLRGRFGVSPMRGR